MMMRVLLWLWATLLLTVVTVFVVTRYVADEDNVSSLPNEPRLALQQLADKAASRINRPVLFRQLLRQAHRELHMTLLFYDKVGKGLLPTEERPPRRDIVHVLRSLSEQDSPLQLKRRGIVIAGPFAVGTANDNWVMFAISHEQTPSQWGGIALASIAAVVMTLLLAYIFARHLVAPLRALTGLVSQVASGQWQSRENSIIARQDELGFLAREFNMMLDRLQQTHQQQQRLLADISHELRSPLARLQMAVGLAQHNPTERLLHRVEQEVETIDRLIGDILALSRADMSVLRREPLSLSALLSPVIDAAAFEADALGKSLTANFDGIAIVCVDKVLLTRVVDNLLRNALRYARKHVFLSISEVEGDWLITVEDDGPGVPSAELDAIFQPFYRVATDRDASSGGTGLGLSIVKAAVTAHRGTVIAMQSRFGGLAIRITLPRESEHRALAVE